LRTENWRKKKNRKYKGHESKDWHHTNDTQTTHNRHTNDHKWHTNATQMTHKWHTNDTQMTPPRFGRQPPTASNFQTSRDDYVGDSTFLFTLFVSIPFHYIFSSDGGKKNI
jgi:hypothetical protein